MAPACKLAGRHLSGPGSLLAQGNCWSHWYSHNWRGKSRSPDMPISGLANSREIAWPGGPGWIMIVQFIAGMSGVCYAMANYLIPYLGLADKNRNVVAVTVAILVAISLINHFGIRLSSLVNDFSVGAEILGTVAIGLLLLAVALIRKTHPIGFLLSHPAQPSGLAYLPAFASSALMSAWTIGGFEAAANVAEETHMPQTRVPTAIVLSEVASVLLGFPVLIGFHARHSFVGRCQPALHSLALHHAALLPTVRNRCGNVASLHFDICLCAGERYNPDADGLGNGAGRAATCFAAGWLASAYTKFLPTRSGPWP